MSTDKHRTQQAYRGKIKAYLPPYKHTHTPIQPPTLALQGDVYSVEVDGESACVTRARHLKAIGAPPLFSGLQLHLAAPLSSKAGFRQEDVIAMLQSAGATMVDALPLRSRLPSDAEVLKGVVPIVPSAAAWAKCATPVGQGRGADVQGLKWAHQPQLVFLFVAQILHTMHPDTHTELCGVGYAVAAQQHQHDGVATHWRVQVYCSRVRLVVIVKTCT